MHPARFRPTHRSRLRRPGDVCVDCCRRSSRCGFTLVELMMGMTITAMLSVVLSGLMMAVQTAREHTEGLEEATQQARMALERIKYMVSQAGVYQTSGQPTTVGLAVVEHSWWVIQHPDVLVVWSGGRNGGLADAGLQPRLPRIEELILYAPDPDNPSRLVEVALPGNTAEIDFRNSNFAATILTLLTSPGAVKEPLCDRLRQTELPAAGGAAAAATFGNARFELVQTPTETDLSATLPGTADWNLLDWAQGIVGGDLGLRQTIVRMELQINRRDGESSGTGSAATAVPFFGSASYRYVYRP